MDIGKPVRVVTTPRIEPAPAFPTVKEPLPVKEPVLVPVRRQQNVR